MASSLRRSVAHVKLIDFGVAKAVDSDVALTTMHTDAGQLIGTLAYMSPEQCDADPLGLDVRSDVYSLGVVMYELVCGRLPYDVSKTSIVAAARTIREEQPVRPGAALAERRRMRRGRRGDLETIVLKCLEKDRGKRYAGANELAADIRRWLAGEHIAAKPPTTMRKMCRWVERHPVAATAGMCLSVVAMIGFGTILSARAFYYQPYRIVLDGEENNYHAARLVNRMGGTLHQWPEDATPGMLAVTGAVLVERPGELEGGQLAVIGYTHGRGGPYANELCAYEIEKSLRVPRWHIQIEDGRMPAAMLDRNRCGRDCHVRAILAADVFPEGEGEAERKELVVSHHLGSYSQSALRIYDLEGNVLYQLWQDGGIQSFQWLPEHHRLICFGADEAAKQRANETPTTLVPAVYAVFAVEPKLDERSTAIMDPDRRGGPTDPVWYRYLHPLRIGGIEYDAKMKDLTGDTFGAVAQVTIRFEFEGHWDAGFSIPFDENGVELLPPADERGMRSGNYRVFNDFYRALVADGKLPRDDPFKLSDVPPIVGKDESTIEVSEPASKLTAP